jgi:single-strand DNA-binding protein
VSFQKVSICGYLGHDPESRQLPDGGLVVNASIASTEKFTRKDGTKSETTTWFRAAFFGRLAEIAEQYLRKGSLVYIEGPVTARAYVNRENEAAASLEVRVRELKMLSTRNAEEGPRDQAPKAAAAATSKSRPAPTPAAPADEQFDDEIPF